jgi:hypothetical protein
MLRLPRRFAPRNDGFWGLRISLTKAVRDAAKLRRREDGHYFAPFGATKSGGAMNKGRVNVC